MADALESASTDIRIDYTADPAWDMTAVRTFPQMLECANAIRAVIGGARPLRPEDLVSPEEATAAKTVDLEGEARARAETARAALEAVRGRLTDALPAGDGAPPGIADVDGLRQVLRDASLYGIAGGHPGNEAEPTALLARARSVAAELERRLAAAGEAQTAMDIVNAVFGPDFRLLPRFTPVNADELGQALQASSSVVGDANAVTKWLQQVERVRPPLRRLRRMRIYAQALGAPFADWVVAQLPFAAKDRWVALPFDPQTKRPSRGRLSLVLHQPVTLSPAGQWLGLLLDQWSESIPSEQQSTAVAYHYDSPGAEAPQALLVAVPPDPDRLPAWDLDTLVAILGETLDLAKLRAVDGQLIELGQLLPAVYVADNPAGNGVSTNLTPLLIREATE